MKINSMADYESASAKIHQLSDAREGTPEAAELAGLVASVREWEAHNNRQADAASSPGHYATPKRPGQPGNEDELRPGPNPRSAHPSGPHAPYETDDPEGLAAGKHVASRSDHLDAAEAADRPSGNIRVNRP